jgi:serine/threonine-protein kinase
MLAKLESASGVTHAALEWGPIPEPLRDRAVRRLGLFALVVASVQLAFVALFVTTIREQWMVQLTATYGSPWWARLPPFLSILTLGLSLGMWWLTRRRTLPSQRLLDLGMGWLFLVSGSVALLHHLHTWDGLWIFTGWSYVSVLIIVSAAVVPATPGRALALAAACAAWDPVMLLITVAGGAAWPAGQVTAMLLLPTALAVGYAYVVSRMVHRFGRELERANELGSYRLVQRLGAGGMGEVWRAEHRSLARPAAIKLIRTESLATGTEDAGLVAARFEREAQATALLLSDHTIKVYDFGKTQDGAFYYVMELLDGIDLMRLVEELGPLPPERVVPILRQACHSLGEAHDRGLVHRDIKPANLYLCRHGRDLDHVKVLDFGLVKHTQSGGGEAKLTQDGRISGTPTFIAPEQATGRTVDHRADLYALGCVAYWLLTGRTVFAADSAIAQIVAHASEAPEPPSRHAAVPPELDAVVLRCLAKRPEERFESADALVAALAAVPLATPWTTDRARAWWADRRPAAPAAERAADRSLAETVPMEAQPDA